MKWRRHRDDPRTYPTSSSLGRRTMPDDRGPGGPVARSVSTQSSDYELYSSPSRSPTPRSTSSASYVRAPGATSPRTSPDPTSSTPSTESPPATSSFRPVWPASSSTPLAPHKVINPLSSPIRTSTKLTARERQVLRLIARGYSYKDVAKELTISTKTVERPCLVRSSKAPTVQSLSTLALGERAPPQLTQGDVVVTSLVVEVISNHQNCNVLS